MVDYCGRCRGDDGGGVASPAPHLHAMKFRHTAISRRMVSRYTIEDCGSLVYLVVEKSSDSKVQSKNLKCSMLLC
jgi:hypothetical protein